MSPWLSFSEKSWRWRIFAITWFAYAGFYLCRKNFSVVMPLLGEHPNFTKLDFANLIFLYSVMYAIGQPFFGMLSDRFGARLVVTGGILLAVASNIGMAFSTSTLMLAPLVIVNGIGQAAGWPGLVKIMANWFRRRERGTVMAWWTTNYVLGGFLATLFATYVATAVLPIPGQGWQRAFWAPAILLGLIGVAYVVVVRNQPSDAGLKPVEDDEAPVTAKQAAAMREARPQLKRILANPVVWIISLGCLFAKITRYAFLFWLPLYMTEQLGYGVDRAGYTAGVFELAGLGGALLAGYLSEKVFESRRFPVTALMFWALGIMCLVQPIVASHGYWANVAGISLIGVANYGPDTLLQGAASQDVGMGLGTGTVSGLISGVGSIGQLLSPYLVAIVAARYGWNSLFHLFVGVAVIGGLLQAILWNNGRRVSPAAANRNAVHSVEQEKSI